MADPANIEAIQAQKALEARQLTRIQALRQVLWEFGVQSKEIPLDYQQLLQRVQAVMATELHTLESEE